MMMSEPHQHNSTVYVPPWTDNTNHTIHFTSPFFDNNVNSTISSTTPNTNTTNNHNQLHNYEAILTALQRYLPSNTVDFDGISDDSDLDLPPEIYTSDEFRMYDFKVRKCTRARSHDWTDCPYAHPGEKARRRDPRKYNYSGTACTDFRKGGCRKGDMCEFAHGVFECWLHPTRYRTQACKDGANCKRRVCFFAHTAEQLRILGCGQQQTNSRGGGGGNSSPDSYDDMFGNGSGSVTASPSMTPVMESPPLTPMAASTVLSRSIGSSSITDLVASLRHLQLNKVKSMPSSWNVNVQLGSPRFAAAAGSPNATSNIRSGFYSLPCTPTRPAGYGYSDNMWDMDIEQEGGPLMMERVESGRELRARMFEKLSKENPLGRSDPGEGMKGLPPTATGPDVGWVSDLLQ